MTFRRDAAATWPLILLAFAVMALFAMSFFQGMSVGVIIIGGCLILGATWMVINLRSKPSGLFWLICVTAAYAFTWPMQLSSIDEYVYWAAIGKYFHSANHFPINPHPILPKHIAYTPGTGLLHRIFHGLLLGYRESHAFFAQALLLLATLGVVISPKRFKASVITFLVLLICLHLIFGSVLARLDVDYLLATTFFAILWLQFGVETPLSAYHKVAQILCIWLLVLIKQIGLLLAIGSGLIIITDIWVSQRQFSSLDKLYFFLLFGGIATFSGAWTYYTHWQQLHSFIQHVDDGASSLLTSAGLWAGVKIFTKALLLGPLDRLGTPAIVYYVLIAGLWRWISRHQDAKQQVRERYLMLHCLWITVLYMCLLCYLQVVLFQVGQAFDHVIEFRRYMGIIFGGIWCYLIARCLQCRFDYQSPSKPLFASIVIVAMIALAWVWQHRLPVDPAHARARAVAEIIRAQQLLQEPGRVCVPASAVNPSLHLKLQYLFLTTNYPFQVLETPAAISQALDDKECTYWIWLDALPNLYQPWEDRYPQALKKAFIHLENRYNGAFIRRSVAL